MAKQRKYLRLSIVLLLPLVFIISECMHKNASTDPRGSGYAGSAACLKCHSDAYKNFIHSAHFLTSRTANDATVHGNFNTGLNAVDYDTHTKVVMEKSPGGLYQVLYVDGKLKNRQHFDIIMGSNRAETYLYWQGAEVKQLPVSYYISLHKWANSPGGYFADSVNFSRVIHERCFECHSSYIKTVGEPTVDGQQPDSLDKSSLVLGIDCERCHGPGAAHVDFQAQNPALKESKYISRFSILTRQQRIDFCSQCHSGNTSVMTKSTFDFKPGDTLANYSSGESFHGFRDAASIDVHGNQVKLLTSSKCFLSSRIECNTCHTMHNNEVKTVAAYSGYCLNCHSEANHNFCKLAGTIGPVIKTDCVDCHMPVKSSKTIVIGGNSSQNNPPFLARTHLIAVYPEETKKVIAMLKAVNR
jgi:hypothetical protein